MREGWEYRRFEDCLAKVPKQRQVKSKEYRAFGKYPIVSQEADLISGYWDDEEYVFKHDKPIVIFGDHTKNIKYIDFDFVVGADGTHILLTLDEIEPKFFYYTLKSINLRNLGYARHFKLLKEKYIPVPSLSEQQRIVTYLDSAFSKVDEMKENAAKALSEAKALFQAELKKCMEKKEGWEEKKLGEVCKYHKEHLQSPGMIYIGLEHIESGTGRLLSCDSTDNVLSTCFKFNKDDVLYGRLRPYLKKVIIAEFDGCCSTEIFPIQSDILEARFLKYWFLTDNITEKINATSAGCRMPRGNMNDVLNFGISYPKMKKDQVVLVTHLDSLSQKVNELQQNYNIILAECDALKQAILKETFE